MTKVERSDNLTQAELKKKLKGSYNLVDYGNKYYKMARKLSTNGSKPRKFMDGYLIQHNNGEWFLHHSTGVELWWISAERVMPGGRLSKSYTREKTDIEKQYFIENHEPEFKTTWLPQWQCMFAMRWLMNNHPNLR